MSRLDALRALEKGVEDGTATFAMFEAAWPLLDDYDPDSELQPQNLAWSAYCDFLDAARALHDAVRPGGEWVASFDTTGFAQSWKDEFEMTHTFSALVPGKPARAWLLALIASLIDEEEEGK